MFWKISNEFLKYAIIAFVMILILFPLYYLFVLSLMSNDEATSGISYVVVNSWNWNNYSDAFNNGFGQAIGLTIILTLVLNLTRIVLYTSASFGLMLANRITKTFVFVVFILVTMIPEIVLFFPLKTFLNNNSLVDNNLIFSLISNAFFSFFLFIYMYKQITSIPIDQIRLAKHDNLRWYEYFFFVYWKRIKIAYFLIVIFTSVQVWNDYLWARFVLSGLSINNISTWYRFLGSTPSGGYFYNQQAAGAMLSLIFPLAGYFIFSPIINRSLRK